MSWLKNKKIITTHSGNFHPDDVFSVAVTSILFNGQIKIVRTRDEKLYPKSDFVIDTGCVYSPETNRFDHHQEGNAGFRANKIPYSSFGLIWKKYGETICGSKKVADILDHRLVEIIDADDSNTTLYQNTLGDLKPFLLTDIIYSLTPTWKEDNDKMDDYFSSAVAVAVQILKREIKVVTDRLEAETLVEEIYKKSEDESIIIFDGEYFLPKSSLCRYPEPIFTVYQDRMKAMWRVGVVCIDEQSSVARQNFPTSWWGKNDAELALVTGISDAVFCRNSGIFAGVKSKEGAIKLAKLALVQARDNSNN